MNPFCLKSDFLRNRLRMAYFWFLRYVFIFLSVMLSGIYASFSSLLLCGLAFLKGEVGNITSLSVKML